MAGKVKCPQCGKMVKNSLRYCDQCGSDLSALTGMGPNDTPPEKRRSGSLPFVLGVVITLLMIAIVFIALMLTGVIQTGSKGSDPTEIPSPTPTQVYTPIPTEGPEESPVPDQPDKSAEYYDSGLAAGIEQAKATFEPQLAEQYQSGLNAGIEQAMATYEPQLNEKYQEGYNTGKADGINEAGTSNQETQAATYQEGFNAGIEQAKVTYEPQLTEQYDAGLAIGIAQAAATYEPKLTEQYDAGLTAGIEQAKTTYEPQLTEQYQSGLDAGIEQAKATYEPQLIAQYESGLDAGIEQAKATFEPQLAEYQAQIKELSKPTPTPLITLMVYGEYYKTARAVHLSWDKIPNAVSYSIYVNQIPLYKVEGTSVLFSDLVPGDSINYSIEAHLENGSTMMSSNSYSVTVSDEVTPAPTPTPKPTATPAFTVTGTYNEKDQYVHLSWDSIPGAVRYTVYRNGESISSPAKTSTDIYGLIPGTYYQFRIKASFADDTSLMTTNTYSITVPAVATSTPKPTATLTPKPTATPKPTLTITGTYDDVYETVHLSWNKIPDAVQYTIYWDERAFTETTETSIVLYAANQDHIQELDSYELMYTYPQTDSYHLSVKATFSDGSSLSSSNSFLLQFPDVKTLHPGIGYRTVNIDNTNQQALYYFTPSVSGYYTLYSTGNADPMVTLYDSSHYLAEDDNGGKNQNFKMTYQLTAGTTYHYVVKMASASETGNFIIRFYQDDATGILTPGSSCIVDFDDTIHTKSYFFTPTTSGSYTLYSSGIYDTYVSLWDDDGHMISLDGQLIADRLIAYDNNSGKDNNFSLTYILSAGTTYYYAVSIIRPETGSITMHFMQNDLDISDVLVPGNSYTVNVNESNQMRYYSFTPTTSGSYTLYCSGAYDTYAILFDNSGILDSDTARYNNNDFRLTKDLTAGTTYIYAVRVINHREARFTIRLESNIIY